MLDVKFDLVKKSLSLSKLHWTLWLSDILLYHPGRRDGMTVSPTTQKSKILAQKSFFERPVLMYSWSDLASSRTVWDNFFWSLTMFVFERSKTLYFCVRVEFFQKQCLSHLQRIFAELVHTHKKNESPTQRCFKKQTLCWRWKEQNHFRLSQSYLRRLSGSTLHAKNEEISKFLYFVSFGKKFEMKLVETVFLSIRFKFKQTSYSWKTN